MVAAGLSETERKRFDNLVFHDEGHGYDAFGLQREFVAFGRLLTSPFYDKWFRVQSSGHEHIPSAGPGVIVCNHSGAVPFDGAMVWTDIVRKSEPPRVARPVADHFVPMIPVIGTVFARGGMVGGSRGNARALLEHGELLLIFPEGVPGIAKHFSQRYQLQEWRVGHAELAIRNSAPVIPAAVIGAEEQMPQIGRIPIAMMGLPFIPITLTPFPLPVRYHILYGPPVPIPELYRPEMADDPAAVREAAGRTRAAVEALIERGLAERKGIF